MDSQQVLKYMFFLQVSYLFLLICSFTVLDGLVLLLLSPNILTYPRHQSCPPQCNVTLG